MIPDIGRTQHINQLPNEILSEIFAYLRFVPSGICKKWEAAAELTLDRKFLRLVSKGHFKYYQIGSKLTGVFANHELFSLPFEDFKAFVQPFNTEDDPKKYSLEVIGGAAAFQAKDYNKYRKYSPDLRIPIIISNYTGVGSRHLLFNPKTLAEAVNYQEVYFSVNVLFYLPSK